MPQAIYLPTSLPRIAFLQPCEAFLDKLDSTWLRSTQSWHAGSDPVTVVAAVGAQLISFTAGYYYGAVGSCN